jgi:hypothetical protein
MRIAALVVVAAALAACPKPTPASAPDAGAELPHAPTAAPGMQPIFDAATAVDARALPICNALYDLPQQRKDACCKNTPGPAPLVKTCAGVLSAALQDKDLVFDEAKAAACVAARTAAFDGCNWVGPMSPLPPAVCSELFHGALDEGARCRSSVECQTGLRCHGAGPLDAGRCGKPLVDGSRCGAATDGLAMVVDQPTIDRAHRECVGKCVLGKCYPSTALGGACHADTECGDDARCDKGACVAGRLALGAACVTGGCVSGALCLDGACRAPRADGEACAADTECARGGCVKAVGAKSGTCGMKCSPFPQPATAP